MISLKDFYNVMAAVVPLYVAMILAYGSVKWWKIFTPDQCSGINRFVALFAVPLLSFHFISTNNIYTMNFRFVAADTLQKLIILTLLFIWAQLRGSLEWAITLFSLSTLPNTLVMGIPLLIGMYGDYSGSLMVQIVVLQCIIWYTLMLFLFEFRAARILISDQFPDTAGSIVSIHVDSDVVSLHGDVVEAHAVPAADGGFRVTVRRSSASRSDVFTPRPSNLTNAEIYSLQSSRNPTPRGSSFNHSDFYSMVGAGARTSNFGAGDVFGAPVNSRGPTPRPSNYEEPGSRAGSAYPAPNPGMFSPKNKNMASNNTNKPMPINGNIAKSNNIEENHQNSNNRDLHMFVWSSSASPVSDVFGSHEYGGNGGGNNNNNNNINNNIHHHGKVVEGMRRENNGGGDEYLVERDEFSFGNRDNIVVMNNNHGGGGDNEGVGVGGDKGMNGGGGGGGGDGKPKIMPPTSVMTRLILIMVWRKLIRNPNTYSSLVGLIWSLVCYRWNINMPSIIVKSISILSDAGLGMAMFSLGLFMALQPRIIACGNSIAAFSMAVRFLTGPAVMAVASIAVGLKGTLLHVAIVQAALPQGIVPFVFAKEYNLHPDILSTGVIFGMLIALPITLVYYILLGL